MFTTRVIAFIRSRSYTVVHRWERYRSDNKKKLNKKCKKTRERERKRAEKREKKTRKMTRRIQRLLRAIHAIFRDYERTNARSRARKLHNANQRRSGRKHFQRGKKIHQNSWSSAERSFRVSAAATVSSSNCIFRRGSAAESPRRENCRGVEWTRGSGTLRDSLCFFFSFPRGKRATEFYLSSGWYIRALGDILRGARERERRSERKREGGGSRKRRRSVGCICTPRFISLARRTLARSLTRLSRKPQTLSLFLSPSLPHVTYISFANKCPRALTR